MNRRRNNTTRYDARTRKLKWRVEWVFESAGHHVVDELVAEDTPLIEVSSKYFQSHFLAGVSPLSLTFSLFSGGRKL